MNIINGLGDLHYCYGVSPGGIVEIKYIERNGLKIAIIDLDTESG